MKKEIKLNSRDNLDNKLIRIGDETSLKYQLQTNYNYRVGFEDNNLDVYTFIDPAGGPFITVGTEIDGHKVKAIYSPAIIEFEQ